MILAQIKLLSKLTADQTFSKLNLDKLRHLNTYRNIIQTYADDAIKIDISFGEMRMLRE
jgi:hypothetical protein